MEPAKETASPPVGGEHAATPESLDVISRDQIDIAVRTLAEAAAPERIVLFGSHARGDARDDSDLDLLVIEREVPDPVGEMVRLRRLLRPLRIPVDVLVFSCADVDRLRDQPGSVLYRALREGIVVHGGPRAARSAAGGGSPESP